MTAAVAWALATALHAGFQVTVTLLVYPALSRVAGARWRAEHAVHSARIAPLVGVVYLLLLLTGGWLLASGPDVLDWASGVATGLALLTTALGAAPIHGRLSTHDPALVARLLVVDRARCAFAVAGALLSAAATFAA